MTNNNKRRIRELGIATGILPTGEYNAITDIEGVEVGHYTAFRGENIRTGITAILPHSGNLHAQPVKAAVHAENGRGKLLGYTQVEEFGEIHTPILLTNTLNIGRVADGLVEFMLSLPGNEHIRSVNPVIGETNDSLLNDIRQRVLGSEEVAEAIRNARPGMVEEGCVGAGAGTVCFGFKGGIGTASRVTPSRIGGHKLGVLVQTNFGGILQINGAPVGRELNRFHKPADKPNTEDGSCMIIVATDAPLGSRNLKRLAKRAILGMARTGSFCANGSGDYVIAFSTAGRTASRLSNDMMNPLFLACVESTEEAIYNSLVMATTTIGFNGNRVEALPIDRAIEICNKYNVMNWDENLPR